MRKRSLLLVAAVLVGVGYATPASAIGSDCAHYTFSYDGRISTEVIECKNWKKTRLWENGLPITKWEKTKTNGRS